MRRFVITKEMIAFSRENEEIMVDQVTEALMRLQRDVPIVFLHMKSLFLLR